MSGWKLEDSGTGRSATQKATSNAAWVLVKGQDSAFPAGATILNAASGNVANASAAATLAAGATTTTYISMATITGAGATGASVVSATITGVLGGTLTYTVAVPAGVTTGITPLVLKFDPPLPASAVNTTIVVTLPALGAGNTNASVTATGYRV